MTDRGASSNAQHTPAQPHGAAQAGPTSALPLPGEPLLDFFFELRLENARDMVRILDFDHEPVLPYGFQGLDIWLLETIAVSDEDQHRNMDRLDLFFRQRQLGQA